MESVPLFAALRLSGVGAALTFGGATDTPAFRTYVEQLLAPQLRPGDVVVWDNLKPHHNTAVRQAVEGVGAAVEPLPPWSPDLTPIETGPMPRRGAARGGITLKFSAQ